MLFTLIKTGVEIICKSQKAPCIIKFTTFCIVLLVKTKTLLKSIRFITRIKQIVTIFFYIFENNY